MLMLENGEWKITKNDDKPFYKVTHQPTGEWMAVESYPFFLEWRIRRAMKKILILISKQDRADDKIVRLMNRRLEN